MKVLEPFEAMRDKCLDCKDVDKIIKCDILDCSLWPYRMGSCPSQEDILKLSAVKIMGRKRVVLDIEKMMELRAMGHGLKAIALKMGECSTTIGRAIREFYREHPEKKDFYESVQRTRRGRPIVPVNIEKVMKLKAMGYGYLQIAKTINMPRTTVFRAIREFYRKHPEKKDFYESIPRVGNKLGIGNKGGILIGKTCLKKDMGLKGLKEITSGEVVVSKRYADIKTGEKVVVPIEIIGYGRTQCLAVRCCVCKKTTLCVGTTNYDIRKQGLFCADGHSEEDEQNAIIEVAGIEMVRIVGFQQRMASLSQRSRKYYKKVIERDDNTCQYCGYNPKLVSEKITMHIDHIVPWAYGGPQSIDNMVVACEWCNKHLSSKVFNCFNDRREYVIKERINRGLPCSTREWVERYKRKAS